MTKIIFFLIAMTLSSQAFSIDCKNHKIYCHIKRLKPDMPAEEAMTLSNLIYKYSKKYKTDPHISVAIGMQESGLRNIHARQYGMQKITTCDESNFCREDYKKTKVYTDLGMFQFHVNSLAHYNIDLVRVMNHDLEYIVKTHISILKDKIKLCEDLKEKAWTCYHSRTLDKRQLYFRLVNRYMK